MCGQKLLPGISHKHTAVKIQQTQTVPMQRALSLTVGKWNVDLYYSN